MNMIGVFDTSGPESTMSLLAASFAKRGHQVVRRNPNGWSADQFEPRFEIVLVGGMRAHCGDIARTYKENGRWPIIVDFGYLRRVDGPSMDSPSRYWSVGLHDLFWLPALEVPADRFEQLDIRLGRQSPGDKVTVQHWPSGRSTFRRPIVICGQVGDDAGHELGPSGYRQWVQGTARAIRHLTDRELLWRPHPMEPDVQMPGLPRYSGTFQQMLAEAWGIVCYSSNAGLEAMVAGVPVFCWPRAPYSGLVNIGVRDIEAPRLPTDEERLSYLHRLAYAQWTRPEIKRGDAAAFIMRSIHHARSNPDLRR